MDSELLNIAPPKFQGSDIAKSQHRFRKIPDKMRRRFESEIKALLHESRHYSRLRGMDTTRLAFDVNHPDYAQAWGILYGLVLQEYGYFGPVNLSGLEDSNMTQKCSQPIQNFSWWMRQLELQVLEEENFGKSNICEYCNERFD